MNVNLEAPASTTSIISEADWEQYSGNWIWRAVQCLVDLPEFSPSPKWIANRLNVGVEKAVEAIDGLERIGRVIRTSKGSYKLTQEWDYINSDNQSREKLLSAQSRIAPQLISKLTTSDAFTSQFFTGDQATIKKYSPHFMRLFKEMSEEAKSNGCTDVIAVQMSFVQLTITKEEGAL
jgi:hypothetical protein